MNFFTAEETIQKDPFACFMQTAEAASLMEEVNKALGDRLKIRTHHTFLLDVIGLWHKRKDHQKRFSKAQEMLFTSIGAEQATGDAIAQYKVGWAKGATRILVACSGIGGELMHLVSAYPDAQIIAVDNALTTLAAAAWNARLFDARNVRFVHARLEDFLTYALRDDTEFGAGYFEHCFFDPDRRKSGTKRVALEDYLPLPAEVLPGLELLSQNVHTKISPMIRFQDETTRHLTWISEGMTLKECVIHSHEHSDIAVHIEETSCIPHVWSTSPSSEMYRAETPLLLELSPTLLRAGLIEEVMSMLGAQQVHGESSLLLVEKGGALPRSLLHFMKLFSIIEELPFAKEVIRKRLQAHAITKIVIKKRYFPMEPFAIRKLIRIPEGGDHVLFCTTRPGEARVAFLCRRLQNVSTFPKL